MALAAESALGLVPPERATWARTLLIEAQSVGAALAFLAPLAGPVRGTADALIERITSIQERFTGARVHPSYARVGGVAHAVPEQVLDDYIALAASVDEAAGPLAVAVARDASPHHGVARLTRDQAINLGTSGIVARASGLDLDLRRHDAALAYPELADLLDRTVLSDGDVPARVDMLMAHVRTSTRLVAACATRLRDLGPGPVDVPLPKVLRLPEGSSYAWLEGGLGIAGVLLVSTGEKTPWRMKIRSASFATMQAMTVALTGVPRSQLATAVTSFPIVIGDVDR